jgi:glycosyltransferase involved in cell wall biosynthesis
LDKSISVLIPAYNEEDKIEDTIKSIKGLDGVEEVVVIDDGSVDNTYQKASNLATKVIKLEQNQGKGAALNRGLEEVNGDIILLLDADLGGSSAEAMKLVEPLLEGRADMSIAKFPPSKVKGGFGLVKGLANWGLRKLTCQEFSAPLSGQRALSKEVVKELKGFAKGFGVEVCLTVDVCQAGFRVEEVPVMMKHRESKRDIQGFIHRGKQFKDVALVLISKINRV